MKKIGSVAEFGPQRDQELWLAFRRALGAASDVVTIDKLCAIAAESPSSRFWVSERRASEVIGAMLRGISISFMSPTRREMFREIFRRFIAYRERHPLSSIYEATFAAVNSPSPKFYITPKTAKIIIYRYKKERSLK